MRMPKKFELLVHNGLVDEVVSQLMSGKEAEVYIVRSMGELRCAKVYKEAEHRSFSSQARYQEGRKVRNSRQARAMGKNTKFGRKEQEGAWQNAEVNALQRLADAGVRVPKIFSYAGGILLMELVTDHDGNTASRLNDVRLTAEQARKYHSTMIAQIVLMLCAGVVHGDLSEYNVLVGNGELVIIDLPQAIDAAGNNNAADMLKRDVANMTAYFSRFAPELLATDYGREIWKLYARGELRPDAVLTGRFEQSSTPADVHGVMRDVESARRWHELNSSRTAE
ncbi:PA4780 family RIO1-like protein kinase [Oryzomonas rubra]|uniref:non-specific serine/threonine protein kinase n=1 Tax=Oryzomonas rubra TaxID=2509454 RepID=A0A5A9XK16_9BACT|nr:PA4780 family RIO1-like protein kinase [Oryzomonas rubra]KAA0893522.1 serine protein kinase RIO [Oryzomonas rubra]